jgi:hypothetical protein
MTGSAARHRCQNGRIHGPESTHYQVAVTKMLHPQLLRHLLTFLLSIGLTLGLTANTYGYLQYKSLEVSEVDGIPVLIKHLPNWEAVKNRTTFARSVPELKAALGDRPIFDLIDFAPGTEAVAAQYDAGKLVIIEYTSPQGSLEADERFTAAIADGEPAVYKRIGNYNVLVFDSADPAAAAALIDEVKYEKQIQWLGKNPFRISAERAFVLTTSDIFMSTLFVIVGGVVVALLGGLIVGFFYFQMREKRRDALTAFSDAGGMTRLNLDGFTDDRDLKRLAG